MEKEIIITDQKGNKTFIEDIDVIEIKTKDKNDNTKIISLSILETYDNLLMFSFILRSRSYYKEGNFPIRIDKMFPRYFK